MSKKNYILLLVFCLLLGGALTYQFLLPGWLGRTGSQAKNPLQDIDFASADRLEVASSDFSGAYDKNGKGWRLDKSVYSLEPGMIEGLLAGLKQAASSTAEVIATNDQGGDELGLGKKADHLVFYRQGKKFFELTIALPPTIAGFYLKSGQGPDSYLINYPLSYDGLDWRSRRISQFEAGQASELTLNINNKLYRYTKAPTGFMPQGQALAGLNIPQVIALFSQLEAQGWPKAGQCLIDGAKLTVIAGGKAYDLELGKNTDAKQAGLSCVRLGGQNAWYLIGQDQTKVLFGSR